MVASRRPTELSPLTVTCEPACRLMSPVKTPVPWISTPVLSEPVPDRSITPPLVKPPLMPLASSCTPMALVVSLLETVPLGLDDDRGVVGVELEDRWAAVMVTEPFGLMSILPAVLVFSAVVVAVSTLVSAKAGPESNATVAAVSINARLYKANLTRFETEIVPQDRDLGSAVLPTLKGICPNWTPRATPQTNPGKGLRARRTIANSATERLARRPFIKRNFPFFNGLLAD